jgi:DNA-binding NarL/FixJ family response regulator
MYLTQEDDKALSPERLMKVAPLLRALADDLDSGEIAGGSLPMLLSTKRATDTGDIRVILVPNSRIEASRRSAELLDTLTARQGQVLNLLMDGMTTKLIATELDVSQRTVENHINAILHKTNTHKMQVLLKMAYARLF